MNKKWKKARVISIHDLSSSVKGVDLLIENKEIFEFKPGQFVTLDLPIGEKRLDRWRSYSIANTSNSENKIELAISYIEGGRASEYFFNKLELGNDIDLKGPEGLFYLPNTISKKMVMICTGTGVVPFKSMIRHISDKGIHHKGIHLIFGTRFQEGIIYKSFFEEMENRIKDFEYTVSLSREEYKGYQGYVHDLYSNRYADIKEDIIFYLCGWQHVIDEAEKRLLDLGYKKEQIVLELYG